MKIRKFKFDEKGPVMCADGEFLHINDLTLLLKEERQSSVNCLETNKKINDPSDFTQKMNMLYKDRIELLDSLLNTIRKGDSYV